MVDQHFRFNEPSLPLLARFSQHGKQSPWLHGIQRPACEKDESGSRRNSHIRRINAGVPLRNSSIVIVIAVAVAVVAVVLVLTAVVHKHTSTHKHTALLSKS